MRKRLEKPRATVDRQLQALHILGVLTPARREDHLQDIALALPLAPGIDPSALVVPPKVLPKNTTHSLATMKGGTKGGTKSERGGGGGVKGRY